MTDQRQRDLEGIKAAYAAYDRDGRASIWDTQNAGFARISRDRDVKIIHLLSASLAESSERRVLDLGCGNGGLAVLSRQHGVDDIAVTGVDLLPDRLSVARERAPWATFVEASADALPFVDASFQVVAAVTLFSSLPSATLEQAVARELSRVLEPGGWLVWYDLRLDNPRNRRVHGIDGKHLSQLFQGWAIDVQSTTLAPPLARHLGRLTPYLYPVLHAVPPLRSHLIGRLRCPS
jgi:ubiquinone/menaquinone biosynthesis C-methylase UbiE